jgi:hypothetical protein
MGKRVIVVESSGWKQIEIDAVCNDYDEIVISKRKWNRSAQCYVVTLKFNATSKSADKTYNILKHLNGDCDEDTCKYCKRFKKEYGGK